MGTTVTRERTQQVGQQFEETFKMVSDGTPAAQTLTSERNLPIKTWDAEGATVAAVNGTLSLLQQWIITKRIDAGEKAKA